MTLSVGVLSFAHYHANFWSEAFNADPRVTLAGVWDGDAARGADAARRHGTVFVPSLDGLLGGVDAVAITSETAFHRPLIEAALARRLPILCEKPLAHTIADADSIVAAVARAGTPFVQSHPKRLDPVSLELRRLVRSGALGAIRLARIRHGHDHGCDPDFIQGWWTDPSLSGGGTLIDEGVHAADLLLWLFGPPASVQATIGSSLGLSVEDTALAAFAWEDGLLAEVATSWSFRAAHDSVELYGSEGTALLSGVDLASRRVAGDGPHLRVSRGGGPWDPSPLVPAFVAGGFHQNVARHFVDALLDGVEPASSARDGFAALALIDAAYDAARTGRRVPLDGPSPC